MTFLKRLHAAALSLILLGALTVSDARAEGAADSQPESNPSLPSGTIIAQPTKPVRDDPPAALPGDLQKVPRLALVLAGGGSRGAAHIGVLKVFKAAGIPIDFVAGSSMGALLGGLYAAGLDPSELERLALDGKLGKAFFPVPITVQAAIAVPRYCILRLFFIKPKIGLYSGKSISKFVHNNLPRDVRNIEDLKIPFAAIAINLKDTRPVWQTTGDLGEAVQASCSVPFFFQPTRRENALLVDGGLRSNLPTAAGKSMASPIVIGVKLFSFLQSEDKGSIDTCLGYADRLTSIVMAEMEDKAVGQADLLIEPQVQYVSVFSCDKKTVKRAIAAGEVAAWKMVPQIKARLRASTIEQTSNN